MSIISIQGAATCSQRQGEERAAEYTAGFTFTALQRKLRHDQGERKARGLKHSAAIPIFMAEGWTLERFRLRQAKGKWATGIRGVFPALLQRRRGRNEGRIKKKKSLCWCCMPLNSRVSDKNRAQRFRPVLKGFPCPLSILLACNSLFAWTERSKPTLPLARSLSIYLFAVYKANLSNRFESAAARGHSLTSTLKHNRGILLSGRQIFWERDELSGAPLDRRRTFPLLLGG